MFEIIASIFEWFMYGYGPEGTNHAVLGALAVGLGSQVVGRGISHFANRGSRRRARRRDHEARRREREDREGYDESIEGLEEQSALARELASQDPDAIYGEERDRRVQDVTDRVSSQLASGQTAVSRALMATGGDATGSGATSLQRLQEGASSTIGKSLTAIDRDISSRAENRERFYTGRADRLQSNAASARGGLYGRSANNAARTGQNRTLQNQAERQMGADISSSLADFGADLLDPTNPDD